MDTTEFIMLVGLPGSGKSTYCLQFENDEHTVVISSDAIRNSMFDSYETTDHNALWKEIHKRVRQHLLEGGKRVILDATNLSKKHRMALLGDLKYIQCPKKCVLMATPYNVCLERNSKRATDSFVPEESVRRMYLKYTPPHVSEGFDEVSIVFPQTIDGFDIDKFLSDCREIDHENPHHTSTIGKHMDLCAQNVLFFGGDETVLLAAQLHDCGKPFCKSYVNSKGETTEVAHYYDHQHVGAYDAALYLHFDKELNLSDAQIMDICTIIYYHMHPYMQWKQSEKAMLKDKALLGDALFNKIILLHDADVTAH